MKKLLVSTMTALLLVLVLTSAAFATPATAERELLFKGSLQATETYVLIFPQLFVDANGLGNATLLGRYTVSYEAVVNIQPDGTGLASPTAHLVAANGDSLFAEGTGVGTSTDTPNISQIVEVYTITGGTGRFEGATGTFTVNRLVNLVTGATYGTISGTIVLP
jgi:hypothetical protein